jgi:hypothetical protein
MNINRTHGVQAIAALSAGALILAAAAAGGSPGHWSTIASGKGTHGAAQDIGLARTADGTLHVAWKDDSGSSAVIRTSSITASGQIGATKTAVSRVPIPSDPALAVGPSGLQLYFAAGAGSPIAGLATSGSATGSTWSTPVRIVPTTASTPGVANAADGTSFQTWAAPSILVHRGLSGTAPRAISSPAGSSNARPNIAADSGGALWVVWCRFGGTTFGTIAQRIDPATGAPTGPQIQLPGSTTKYQGSENASCVLEATIARREPLVARAGGGVYAAGTAGYPTLTRVLVWRLDASGVAGKLVAGQTTSKADLGFSDPALAAAPDGRIWVAWVDRRPGGTRIVARRSNKQGASFGAAVTAAPPGGLLTGAVNLSAQSDRLDVVVLQQTRAGTLKMAHTQLLPGLTLLRGRVARRGLDSALVSVKAVDASDPVSGVRIRIGSQAGTTNAKGTAQILVHLTARKHRVTASAVRVGYVGARVTVAVPARARSVNRSNIRASA